MVFGDKGTVYGARRCRVQFLGSGTESLQHKRLDQLCLASLFIIILSRSEQLIKHTLKPRVSDTTRAIHTLENIRIDSIISKPKQTSHNTAYRHPPLVLIADYEYNYGCLHKHCKCIPVQQGNSQQDLSGEL